MAKDPALLFYTSDFLTGTVLMTNEQVGIYIRLLCVMHQHGGEIDIASFDHFVGQHEIIRSKFEINGGKAFNARLVEEMAKRERKSCNLSANAKKSWEKRSKCNANAMQMHMQGHMPIENENENENIIIKNNNNLNTKTITPAQKLVEDFGKEYETRTGHAFKADKKHFILVSGLIKKHGLEAVQKKAAILAMYCQRAEAWFVKDGFASFTIETLSSKWNSLLPQVRMTDEEISNKKVMELLERRRAQNDD